MLHFNKHLATPRTGWMPPWSAHLRLVEGAVLVGVMGHFAALLAGMVVF